MSAPAQQDPGEARLAAFRAANEARAAKAKAQHAVSNPRNGETSGQASRDAAPKPAPAPKRERDRIAEAANVSPKTVERVQKLKREDPAAQLELAAPCPRCGARMVPLEELVQVALEARGALDVLRLCVPGSIKAAVLLFAQALPCYVGRCVPGGER